MKAFFLFASIALFSTSLMACESGEISFPQSDLCAKVEWLQGPNYNQFNSIEISLNKESTYKLNIIPWMVMSEGHEHGSRPVKITATSSTHYIVEKIYFMGGMMGDWYLRFQLLNADNSVLEEVRTLVELAE